LAAQRNSRRWGGTVIEGDCLDSDGKAHEGRFAIVGPASYFSSADGNFAGIAIVRVGSSHPSLFSEFKRADLRAISGLVAGKEMSVPVDVTSGDALKVRTAERSFVERIKSGGVMMIPILAVGIFALWLCVKKFVQLRTMRVPDPAVVAQTLDLVSSGQIDAATKAVDGMGEPVSRLLREGISHMASPKEHVEEILYEHMLNYMPMLDRHLGTLAVLGAVEPLLGLLGTVSGIIHTFQIVTLFGSGDPKLFSAGISEALTTTMFGLGIAIPILLVHAYFSRRVKTIVATMEHTVALFVNELFHRVDHGS
jgi:biopolymer transport protein ExbB